MLPVFRFAKSLSTIQHRHNRFLRGRHLNNMLVTTEKSANTYKFESGVRKASSTQTINEDSIAAQCPFIRALQVVGNRWRPVLLWTMSKGISRYGEMRRANPNISEKVLAYELRKLQSLGLIVKEVEKRERVTMTEYKLTERGFGVIPLLEHMESWAKADRESEIASQKR